MTGQKIVVVDGRKYESFEASGCRDCVAAGERELCEAIRKKSTNCMWINWRRVGGTATEDSAKPRMLVVHHGNSEQSRRVEELLAQGYKLLSYDFTRQEALLVLDDGVVHPQFSVKG